MTDDLLLKLANTINEHGGTKHIKSCAISVAFDNYGKDGTDATCLLHGDMPGVFGNLVAIMVHLALGGKKQIPPDVVLDLIKHGFEDAMEEKDKFFKEVNK